MKVRGYGLPRLFGGLTAPEWVFTFSFRFSESRSETKRFEGKHYKGTHVSVHTERHSSLSSLNQSGVFLHTNFG